MYGIRECMGIDDWGGKIRNRPLPLIRERSQLHFTFASFSIDTFITRSCGNMGYGLEDLGVWQSIAYRHTLSAVYPLTDTSEKGV